MAAGKDSAVLFDVDGTLMDTVYLHTVAWWEALRQHGEHVPMAEVHRSVGKSGGPLLDGLLGEHRDHSRDEAIGSAHDALYAQFWTRLTPLDGAADLLRACAGRGLKVVLASSASAAELKVMTDALGADDAIDAATTADDVEEGKPEPDLVRRALELADVPPERALFVGDAVWDAVAARRAGVRCIGLLSGGTSRQELFDGGADQVYTGPADLLAHLDHSMLGAP
ncbi:MULTISPECIES: HAD family hydrolase [unclassified Streptomyces]|uniref:HAD family hydrolase n=1 Tax=unclassified Streptomyces TaxID=2593676 RepID=UPI002E2E2A41|nr:HAD family hydrolase [Streptomyces sp. NBC_00223]